MFFSNSTQCSVHIDFSNLQHTTRALNFAVNYEKLMCFLRKTYNPRAVSVYVPLPPGISLNRNTALACCSLGYRVITRDTQIMQTAQGPRFIKGNMDIEFCTDALMMQPWAQTYVFVTGDSDFTYLCGVLQSGAGGHAAKVIAVSSRKVHSMSEELLGIVNEFIELADISDQIRV